jgi:hypothetical protein
LEEEAVPPRLSVSIGRTKAFADEGSQISGLLAQGVHKGSGLAIGTLEELLQKLIGPGRAGDRGAGEHGWR